MCRNRWKLGVGVVFVSLLFLGVYSCGESGATPPSNQKVGDDETCQINYISSDVVVFHYQGRNRPGAFATALARFDPKRKIREVIPIASGGYQNNPTNDLIILLEPFTEP